MLLDMLLLLSRYFYFHSFRSLMQKNTMDFFFGLVCKLSAFNANSSHKIEAKRRRKKKQNSHVSQRDWLAAVCTVCAHSFCTLLRLTYAKELWFDYYDVQITITDFFFSAFFTFSSKCSHRRKIALTRCRRQWRLR